MRRATIKHQLNRMVDRRRLLARVEQAILIYAREQLGATDTYLTPELAQQFYTEAQIRGDRDAMDDCKRWLQLQPPRRTER